ncbi:hypothetical protein ABZ410_08425 [Streptomyces cinnamoneus]|uniref:hypothetical protein n=1 Tax=Streptomyces cinnamoneus TaxID=53446 RepID=UPI0033DD519D
MTTALNDLTSTVPYITSWSVEQPIKNRVIAAKSGGIAYVNETLHDRDHRGVLWAASGLGWGRGRPEYKQVHPQRQRRAMGALLCQVCGEPAGETRAGNLWLLDTEGIDDQFPVEGERTTHPPVCPSCAGRAIKHCPTLRRQHVLVRVKRPTLLGVHGTLYSPGNFAPVAGDKAYVPYTAPEIRWVLAGQLYAHLYGITSVTGDELAAIKEGAR